MKRNNPKSETWELHIDI